MSEPVKEPEPIAVEQQQSAEPIAEPAPVKPSKSAKGAKGRSAKAAKAAEPKAAAAPEPEPVNEPEPAKEPEPVTEPMVPEKDDTASEVPAEPIAESAPAVSEEEEAVKDETSEKGTWWVSIRRSIYCRAGRPGNILSHHISTKQKRADVAHASVGYNIL